MWCSRPSPGLQTSTDQAQPDSRAPRTEPWLLLSPVHHLPSTTFQAFGSTSCVPWAQKVPAVTLCPLLPEILPPGLCPTGEGCRDKWTRTLPSGDRMAGLTPAHPNSPAPALHSMPRLCLVPLTSSPRTTCLFHAVEPPSPASCRGLLCHPVQTSMSSSSWGPPETLSVPTCPPELQAQMTDPWPLLPSVPLVPDPS